MNNTQLYTDFLDEMSGLKDLWRLREERRNAPGALDAEDPDVRRLLEALAWFSARTRQAALRNLGSVWQRLSSSYFSTLAAPLPAAGMVRAVVTERLVEQRLLPGDALVRLSAASGQGTFRTLRGVRILPIHLERTQVLLPERGFRLALHFRARFPRKEPVSALGLHVRWLDDYLSSLEVLHQLRRHLRRVSVVYDAAVDEATEGSPCGFSFGQAPVPELEAGRDAAHPFERLRSFFHFPEQELFLNVEVAPHQTDWSRFCLCLDLDQGWKGSRRVNPDIFQLFAVPVVNLRREMAQPITSDGTRSCHPIVPVQGGRGTELHSVLGVYQETQQGLSPLRCGVLGLGEGYEVEELDEAGGTRHQLRVHMPEALTAPRTLTVEALWHEPGFTRLADGRLSVSLPDRESPDLRWEALGDLRAPVERPLPAGSPALLELLSLKVKPALERDELVSVMEVLIPPGSPYRPLVRRIQSVKVERTPAPSAAGTGLKQVYSVAISGFRPEEEALTWSFALKLRDLLDTWSPEGAVELAVEVGREQTFPPLPERAPKAGEVRP